MVGSLWTGISGLATHQAALDNESHNIANVNTIGYKSSRISFADQMYQDSIGKGSKVLNAEKVYSQGNMKTTGVSYDMALQGEGFFTVKDPNATGSSEEFYTRAGNFRMGEAGTLQDANAYDVVGWAMSSIDPTTDVVSTNSNIQSFTNDYNKVAANQIVKKDGIIETITGKLTDYTQTAKSDEIAVMGGLGYKTTSTKINSVDELMKDYDSALKSYAMNPEVSSSPSISQINTITLPNTIESGLSTESDQIYVYVDGKKYTQSYIETTATQNYDDTDGLGVVNDADHKMASRIATYRALADELSKLPWATAYVSDVLNIFDPIEGSKESHTNTVAADPTITIESLIPGKSFIVGNVAEYISSTATAIPGSSEKVVTAVSGTGAGAVESSKNALIKVSAGFQRDVWSSNELTNAGGDIVTEAQFSLVDPNDSSNVFTLKDALGVDTTALNAAATTVENMVDELVVKINADPNMSKHIKAHNYNGNLVIEPSVAGATVITGLDVIASSNAATAAVGTISGNVNKSAILSINSGADAEFLEMVNTLNQTSSKDSIQLRLDTLNISDSAFGEFNVDETGLITMQQDGAEFAVGQVAIAMFSNQQGLDPQGNNLLAKTNVSGAAMYNENNDKTGLIQSKTLELSTADLSESLVNLMVYQRAFEANSKSITTSDQILTTLIQLKK